MTEKEFKAKEIIFELKLVQMFSIDDISSLKEKILQKIKDRLQYNFQYIEKKIEEVGGFTFGPCTNPYGYFKGRFTEYTKISKEQKYIMNNDISRVRANMELQFTKEQKEIIDGIYLTLQKTIEHLFNNSPTFQEPFSSSYLEHKINEVE